MRTTVPAAVRKALSLRPGEDRLQWEIRGEDAIVRRAGAVTEERTTPRWSRSCDCSRTTSKLIRSGCAEFRCELYQRVMAITEAVEVDPDETFDGSIIL